LKKIIYILTLGLFVFYICHVYYTITKDCTISYNFSNKNNYKRENKYKILIDINEKKLYLINKSNEKVEKTYIIASGKPSTPSPIGTWTIISKGSWGKGFGTRWMGFNVPWGKYGIHGTDKPYSIGGNLSHGCIRMFNKDVEDLYPLIEYGTTVIISGGPYGPFGNGFRLIKPGDRGSDVYEIQRIMKQKGYYPGYIDGIYGDGMKYYVVKFRKDNNITITHNIDSEFYKALGIELFE
jgi:hypothetical protein